MERGLKFGSVYFMLSRFRLKALVKPKLKLGYCNQSIGMQRASLTNLSFFFWFSYELINCNLNITDGQDLLIKDCKLKLRFDNGKIHSTKVSSC